MSGNVFEWCWDWLSSYVAGSFDDPTGPNNGSYRVIRGGSWYNDAPNCRSAYRNFNFSDTRNSLNGFRVVRTK